MLLLQALGLNIVTNTNTNIQIWWGGGGMALSICTALDNVAESSIQSITLAIHKA